MITKFTRGMVYWINIPDVFGGNVISGRRPCVIVSNDVGNMYSEIITVVPCTTNQQKVNSQPTHCTIGLFTNITSIALCENIITINKKMATDFIGVLDPYTMKNVDKCVKITLTLEEGSKTTDKPQNDTIPTTPQKRELPQEQKDAFIADYEKYGVSHVVNKYKLVSKGAAYQRYIYYKKQKNKKS